MISKYTLWRFRYGINLNPDMTLLVDQVVYVHVLEVLGKQHYRVICFPVDVKAPFSFSLMDETGIFPCQTL